MNTTRGQGDALLSSRGGTETEVEGYGGRGDRRSRRTEVKEVKVAEAEESDGSRG